MADIRDLELPGAPDEAPLRSWSPAWPFYDAYDLFVIGIVSTLLKEQWQLDGGSCLFRNAVKW